MNSKTITASWLRQHRPDGVLPLSAEIGVMMADALEIADPSARCDIESNCESHMVGEHRWWDTSRLDPDDEWAATAIAQAVRYLDARGLIERDQKRPELVRMLESSEVVA